MVKGTFIEFQLQIYDIGIPKSEYHSITVIHVCVAVVHAFFIIVMITSSIHARRLVFQPEMKLVYRFIANSSVGRWWLTRKWRLYRTGTRQSETTNDSTHHSFSGRVASSFNRASSFVFARDGILGVDGAYFDHILIVRELVETSLQTYQLYRMTQVLPRQWLIRFYVALLVANCWIVPGLHRYYRNHETIRRLLSLLCDAVLDMLSSIGVSIIIFATYAPQYHNDGYGFDFDSWYDDDWFTNMQQEFQMMLVASWVDMLSRLVFALGLLQCVEAVKELLTPPSNPSKEAATVSATQTPKILAASTSKQVADLVRYEKSSPKQKSRKSLTTSSHSTPSRIVHFIVHVACPTLFVIWGITILALQLAAEAIATDAPCSQWLKPWLSSKPGCSLVEIDCVRLQSTGHDDAFERAWEAFNPHRTTRVAIRHCPQLNMSRKIQLLTSITDVKLYNATIDSWSNDAALTSTHHADLRAVFLIRTDFPNGLLPEGLTSSSFPKTVVNFMVCISNLTTLPTDLDSKWPFFVQVSFEYTQLTKIEDVIIRLFPLTISMAGSPISEELPRNVTHPSPLLLSMSVQETGISTLWSWLDPFTEVLAHSRVTAFNARGTPYCRELEEIAAKKRTAFTHANDPDAGIMMDTSTPEKLAFVLRIVDCSDKNSLTYFPVAKEGAKHGLGP